MRILVTGSEGYIGSVLMPKLKKLGYDITGYDICFYKDGILTNSYTEEYHLIKNDIRKITEDELLGFDTVIHLAALSNDPLGKINEKLTYEINYKATLELAKKSKKVGVKRFIFASSCSLYGASSEKLTEKDLANPQTAYGRSKIMAEEAISKLADDNFSPIFMRNATAFGISSRMRFDIVVNNLTGFAHTINEIKILSDGKSWRPLVHVSDICDAMIKVLNAPRDIIHNQSFNVGSNSENYQIKDVALIIQEVYKDCKISLLENSSSDTRNYNVCFDKLNEELNFNCKVSLLNGIKELKEIYEKVELSSGDFESRYFTRLKQIQYLLENGYINSELNILKGVKNEF